MKHNLSQNLYITYSNQKVRDIKKYHSKPLDKVTTLDNLIQELFELNNFHLIIDSAIASSILYRLIGDNKIDYFSYLEEDTISLNTLYDFFVKCQRNSVEFKTFHTGKKLEAIERLFAAYQDYKQKNNLVDIADIEQIVLEYWDEYFVGNYDNIYVDDFKVGDINYIKSKTQKEIFSKLSKYKTITSTTEETSHDVKIIKPHNEVFDNIDEVKTALKIVRKLLENGCNEEDILVVASDISEYAPLYKLYLDEYGLQGYSSIGTPIGSFSNQNNPNLKNALDEYQIKINQYKNLYKKLGLNFSKKLEESIKNSIKILDEKIGVELTEPNQIVGLNREYKHIIFIGTDINHFPPKASDNFLYSYDDDLSYFYANNYFLSSKTQFDELKKHTENLYIITASYSGKRELEPSIILDNQFDEKIDISHIKSINDLALEHKTIIPDRDTKEYYESIVSKDFTKYDGLHVENIKAKHLSASQINRYNTCPLSYLYLNKLRVKPPKQSEEGFDVMEQGSLMHLCFEYFGAQMHIRSTIDNGLENVDYMKVMYGVSMGAYKEFIKKSGVEENIHHKIFLSSLQAGLQDNRKKGILAKFVDYYIENAQEFNYFKNSEFEKEFALDNELKPYELKDKDDQNYFIKGFIDRFDNLDNHINIVDYKSKKVQRKDKKKQEDMETLKDIQLALYILYAKQKYPNKTIDAHLLSFKGNDYGIKFASLDDIDDNEVKQVVFDTKKSIENGDFHFDNSDEQACGWCDMRFICHESVLSKKVEGVRK